MLPRKLRTKADSNSIEIVRHIRQIHFLIFLFSIVILLSTMYNDDQTLKTAIQQAEFISALEKNWNSEFLQDVSNLVRLDTISSLNRFKEKYKNGLLLYWKESEEELFEWGEFGHYTTLYGPSIKNFRNKFPPPTKYKDEFNYSQEYFSIDKFSTLDEFIYLWNMLDSINTIYYLSDISEESGYLSIKQHSRHVVSSAQIKSYNFTFVEEQEYINPLGKSYYLSFFPVTTISELDTNSIKEVYGRLEYLEDFHTTANLNQHSLHRLDKNAPWRDWDSENDDYHDSSIYFNLYIESAFEEVSVYSHKALIESINSIKTFGKFNLSEIQYPGHYKNTFRQLFEITKNISSLNIDQLLIELNDRLKKQHEQSVGFNIFGTNIPKKQLLKSGIFFLVILQLYLLLHLKALNSRINKYDEAWKFPWIGIYNNLASKSTYLLTATILPIVISIILWCNYFDTSMNLSISPIDDEKSVFIFLFLLQLLFCTAIQIHSFKLWKKY